MLSLALKKCKTVPYFKFFSETYYYDYQCADLFFDVEAFIQIIAFYCIKTCC